MSKERREELASLSFSEKIKILEKLRARSLILAEARKRLARKKRQTELDWSQCPLVEGEQPVLKGTQFAVEDIVANYENGRSIAEISEQVGVDHEKIKALLGYVEQRQCLVHPL